MAIKFIPVDNLDDMPETPVLRHITLGNDIPIPDACGQSIAVLIMRPLLDGPHARTIVAWSRYLDLLVKWVDTQRVPPYETTSVEAFTRSMRRTVHHFRRDSPLFWFDAIDPSRYPDHRDNPVGILVFEAAQVLVWQRHEPLDFTGLSDFDPGTSKAN